MINIADKTKHIGLYVSEAEFNRINENTFKYGFKNRAEYIRSALNFFDERRYNASKNNEINIIQDCINLLLDHKKQVSNAMIQGGLQELQNNIANNNHEDTHILQGNEQNGCKNIADSDGTILQETSINLQDKMDNKNEKRYEPFENIIQTLIRITHMKGKPSDDDFKFQASRCGKSKKEVMDYYDENYEFIVKESDKYV